MALKPTTGLEDHPVNTTGLNGIVNANWNRLEAIFAPLAAATPAGRIAWNTATKTFLLRAGVDAILYSGTPGINFAGAVLQTIALTGDAVFSSLNLSAGATVTVAVLASGANRNVSFPAWKWIGRTVAPTSLPSGKTAYLRLVSVGTTNADVLAEWIEESVGGGSGGTVPIAQAMITLGAYLYWPCNETSGTTIADASGNARNAVISGTYALNQVGPALHGGVAGKAINFTAGRVTCGGSVFNHTDWSAAAWVRPTFSAPGHDPALWCQHEPGSVRYSTHMAADREGFVGWNGTTALTADVPATQIDLMKDNGWMHVVMVRRATGRMLLYVNGQLRTCGAFTLGAATTQPLTFGASSAAFATPWLGDACHLGYFDKVLTEAQIFDLYNAVP